MTPNHPGAIAIIQLVGDVESVLRKLTNKDNWPIARMRLVNFADIDEGLAGRVTDDIAQLMPHGGPRVVQRIIGKLIELGAKPIDECEIEPRKLYPEAADTIEALMLQTMARAQSPLAIDLLLEQPDRWRRNSTITEEDRVRSRRLNRLVNPPSVVLAGPPNVGKSTLSNALIGRSMSIAIDQPGTTRDYTTGRIEFAGLVVRWHDTPGIRATTDPIEKKAIEISQRLMADADLLIAITDHKHDWPTLTRDPDLKVANKSDKKSRRDADLNISATTGANLAEFVASVRDTLVPPADLDHPGPWLFDDRLLK